MSAWIVSQAHIDVLVQALAEGEHVTTVDPDEIGRVLWRENHRSVNARYDQRHRTPPYAYRRPAQKIPPSGVLYAIGCYDYQSCEHDGWESSQARRWVSTLAEALRAHPDVDPSPEFGTYPWGYDEEHVHQVPAST